MNRRDQPPVHPLAPALLALIAAAALGIAYWGFGVGKDAFLFSVAAVGVFATPVVIVFGIAGLVFGVRYLLRRRKRMRASPKEYPFVRPNENNRYRIFPDAMEDSAHVFFHGTAAANLEPILSDGFRIPSTGLTSVSFAKDSSLALRYACSPPSQPPRKGCIIAVSFDDPNSPRIVSEPFGKHVHRPDALPCIIGYCMVPEDYVFS